MAPKKELKMAPMAAYLELLDKFSEPPEVDILGYTKTIAQVEDKLEKSSHFIVSGPSGVGKTVLTRRVSKKYAKKHAEKRYYVMYIDSLWMTLKEFGEPEAQLNALTKEAISNAPSIVFFDDIEIIFSKRNRSDFKERIANKVIERLKYLSDKEVIVIGATDQPPEQLDPRLSRFFGDERVEFPRPSRDDRVEMLKILFPKFTEQQLESIADVTYYYLFNDLKGLRNASKDSDYDSVRATLVTFKPRSIREITTPCPPIRWDDIGGYHEVKTRLQRRFIEPLRNPEKFKRFNKKPSKGAILYGPPGCSKTMLGRALATESGYNFIYIKGPELFNKYVGDSEAAVRRLYSNAREIAPCIIFFDEIDGLANERSDKHGSPVGDKIVTQLLIEFNGPPDNVFTIAATNKPDKVDKALLRPSRLDSAIYIPLPSEEDRVEIFKIHMRPLPVKCDKSLNEITKKLAKYTRFYSGDDINKVCDVAADYALDEASQYIELRHFGEAIKSVYPSTTREQLKSFERYLSKTRRSGLRSGLEVSDITRDLCSRFNDSLNIVE